jgi:hypothetical protein
MGSEHVANSDKIRRDIATAVETVVPEIPRLVLARESVTNYMSLIPLSVHT